MDRAIDVLEVLAATGEELPLGEIARRTGLNVSTCHHLLATLVNRGYVGRSRLGRLYFIGARAMELSRGRPDLVETALPELQRLSAELAAVSYSVPTEGAAADRLEEVRAAIQACANRLSEQLGLPE